MTTRTRTALALAALWALLASAAAAQAPPAPIAAPTAQELARGAKIFGQYCARCHGFDATGGMGPPLARPRLRRAADEAGIIDILLKGVPGTAMPAAWSLSTRDVAEVAAYVRSLGQRPPEPLPGDAERGRAVYARSACVTCHLVNGEGGTVGPELSAIGVMRGSVFLRQSLVDPSAARPERSVSYEPYGYPAYEVVRARLRAGDDVEGVRLNEDAFTIQIRDRAGRLHSLRKSELSALRPDPSTSLMPAYKDVLTAAELNDLVSYLMTLRSDR